MTESEDFPMMANIYSALASGAIEEVVYGRIEPALSFYRQALDRLRERSGK